MVRPRPRRSSVPLKGVAEAYSDGATAWADGPARVYGRLAKLLVDFSPTPLSGQLVLDLGSGTGVGSRAAAAAGARVVAADLAPHMLLVDQAHRPPGVAGDAVALPFRNDSFDAVLAPFSLNHLDDPSTGVHEAGRVSGVLLASTYAADDDHPAKQAVETALGELGWVRPEWYSSLKMAMAAWGTVDAATQVVERGGLRPIRLERREVAYDDLGAHEMIAWRMGLAQSAPFVATLEPVAQASAFDRALELLGGNPTPIVRKVIFILATR